MTKKEALTKLVELFSAPCEFSTGDSDNYIIQQTDHSIMVSKGWGYHATVIYALRKFFEEYGSIDNGSGGCIVSPTDFIGTNIFVLSEEEFNSVREMQKENPQDSIYFAAVKYFKKK